ncbi:hypothetical protein HBI34_225040 [Parastagonospora nodorum]|nr:hypothetical protein HBI34_225040 [Parastagonospora nodorum]
MVRTWSEYCEYDMLMIHIFNSVCVYHSDTMKYLQRELPKCDEECDQMASSFTTMILFSGFAMEPRIGLGVAMLKQALCTMPTKGDATMVSLETTDPLVMTEFAHALCANVDFLESASPQSR